MGDKVDWSFVNLMFDGAVEHVEWLSGALVQELVQEEGEPGR